MADEAPTLKQSLRRAAEELTTASRTVLAVSLGGPVLLGRGLWWALDHAAEEGNQQLKRLGGLWARHRGSEEERA